MTTLKKMTTPAKKSGSEDSKRRPNFSAEELQIFASLIQQHNNILSANYGPTITKNVKDNLWMEITDKVNAVGGHMRTVDELKRKKKNLKTTAKSKATKNRAERNKTGGGPAVILPISTAEELILTTLTEIEMTGIEDGIDVHIYNGKCINTRAITTMLIGAPIVIFDNFFN